MTNTAIVFSWIIVGAEWGLYDLYTGALLDRGRCFGNSPEARDRATYEWANCDDWHYRRSLVSHKTNDAERLRRFRAKWPELFYTPPSPSAFGF